jgi:hypothetical protein
MLPRARWFLCVFALSFVTFACGGEPPSKEMEEAQVAIDAARSAKADVYAVDELKASEEALQHAREAVDEHDYRLALNHALDSRERAQTAAGQAEIARVAARQAAEQGLGDVRGVLTDTETRITALDTRANARALAPVKAALVTAQNQLQEASTAFEREDYAAVAAATLAVSNSISALNETLDSLAKPAPVRRR